MENPQRHIWSPTTNEKILQTIAGKKWVHFMHVSKTGGTSVRAALMQAHYTSRYGIYIHPHSWNLSHLRRGEYTVFFMRDPLSRYISGFYSRLRQGQPRYDRPWREHEKVAFSVFDHPSQLGEAIMADDPQLRESAFYAMRSIGHVRVSYAQWLLSAEFLTSKSSQILFIGFQEHLTSDFGKLKQILGLPENLELPSGEVDTHRTPDHFNKSLSPLARKNLEIWYRYDYELYQTCKDIATRWADMNG